MPPCILLRTRTIKIISCDLLYVDAVTRSCGNLRSVHHICPLIFQLIVFSAVRVRVCVILMMYKRTNRVFHQRLTAAVTLFFGGSSTNVTNSLQEQPQGGRPRLELRSTRTAAALISLVEVSIYSASTPSNIYVNIYFNILLTSKHTQHHSAVDTGNK